MSSIDFDASAHRRGIIAIIVAAVLWSTGGLFIKLLPFNALTILFYRSVCAALLFGVVYGKDTLKFNKRVALSAVFYAGLLIAFVIAAKLTTAANAIFLQYSAPIYVLIAEPLLFKTRLENVNILTIIVCFAGMTLFFADGLQGGGLQGNLIACVSGILLASLLLSQRANTTHEQISAIFWGNIAVAVIGFPAFMASAMPTMEEAAMLGFLGFVQIGLGYLLFTYGLGRTLAIESALLAMIEPILTPIWVWFGYGERPTNQAILGGCMIVAALAARIIWIETKKR